MALHDDELTDDYVASLLKEDAVRSNRWRYSDVHSGTTRPRNHAKPNTRFFRHIVRDVDSHNATLLRAKEASERRARRRDAQRAGDDRRRADGRV